MQHCHHATTRHAPARANRVALNVVRYRTAGAGDDREPEPALAVGEAAAAGPLDAEAMEAIVAGGLGLALGLVWLAFVLVLSWFLAGMITSQSYP